MIICIAWLGYCHGITVQFLELESTVQHCALLIPLMLFSEQISESPARSERNINIHH